jgi:hypothetical protein
MSSRIFVVNTLDTQTALSNICYCYSLSYFERKYVSMGLNLKNHVGTAHSSRDPPPVLRQWTRPCHVYSRLHHQSQLHFAWQLSERVLQTMRCSYLSHMIPAAMKAGEYWHVRRSAPRNTIYAQTNSHNVPICNISPGLLVLPAPEAGDCGINPNVHTPQADR